MLKAPRPTNLQADLSSGIMTLPQFILDEQKRFPGATGELTQLFMNIQYAVKSISVVIRKNMLGKMQGQHSVSSTQVTGEDMKLLSKMSNELFIDMIRSSNTTCLLISHGNQSPIEVEPLQQGKYVVCFNSLDDASGISCQTPVGSIIAVYKRTSSEEPNIQDALQPGRNMVAAAYALYGSATIFVVTLGNGVYGFTLDPNIGEFVLTDPEMHIASRGNIYSVNEGSMYQWEPAVAEYVESKKCYRKVGLPYRCHYVGAMTADVHRTLKYGGIYIHPTTLDYPMGKLCLLSECNPMAFILTQAGGLASDGRHSILDIVPNTIHQKCQFFMGSRDDVRDLITCFKKQDKQTVGRDSKIVQDVSI